MASSKPAILVIGGGWHTPDTYIQQADPGPGNCWTRGSLPSPSFIERSSPPTAGLAEGSANIRSYARKILDVGKQVVVVMHSYGGQVGTNSLYGLGLKARAQAGLPGGISRRLRVL
ncbi:hypothetical protein QBC44DRAFT_389642 [Cladorrhinum sp. PSN332]|nr:hypothetical protein QBC44DRAFT_389642 [Cladorrhinum sp. PSN332]